MPQTPGSADGLKVLAVVGGIRLRWRDQERLFKKTNLWGVVPLLLAPCTRNQAFEFCFSGLFLLLLFAVLTAA